MTVLKSRREVRTVSLASPGPNVAAPTEPPSYRCFIAQSRNGHTLFPGAAAGPACPQYCAILSVTGNKNIKVISIAARHSIECHRSEISKAEGDVHKKRTRQHHRVIGQRNNSTCLVSCR